MITITVDDSAFRAYLDRLTDQMGNVAPVMESIGQEIESRISGRFETETDPTGARWHPWADSTRETYPKNGNGRILERYGDMLGSLNWQADASSVRVGFGQPYATYHEFGTKHMPRRGLLFEDPEAGILAPDDEASVLDMITAWLDLE